MRRLTIQVSAVFMTALLLVFAGCSDKDYYNPDGPDGGNSNDPSLNSFATSKNVVLNVNYEAPKGLISVFDVYTENPLELKGGRYALNTKLTPIAGGICVGGQIEINKTVPASAKELYVYSNDLFVPMLMSAKIEGAAANFEVVDLTIESSDAAGSRSVGDNKLDGYLNKGSKTGETTVGSESDINSYYKPNYVLENKAVPGKYLNRIKEEFKNGVAVKNQDYYHDAVLYLHKDADDIKLAMIHGDASNSNSLCYFFYEGTPEDAKSPTFDQSKVKEIVVLPYAKLDKLFGMKAGDMVQLMYYDETAKKYVKKFPKNTTIGFVLRSDAFKAPSGKNKASVKTNTDKFYSLEAWNKSFDPTFPQHTIFFNAATEDEEESFICFGFEDSKGGGDKDCNDVMFHVDVNPADAIKEPPHVPEAGEVLTSETLVGTLGFEDYWPYKGDYDLNDVVVSYSSKITYVQKTEDGIPVVGSEVMVKSIEDNIKLVHSGADYTNGFAYKVGFASSLLKAKTIDGTEFTPVTDGDGFIVNISDDVSADVQQVRLAQNSYVCTPKTFKVKLSFNEDAISQKNYNAMEYAKAPYNPFIRPDNKKGHEVHLPFFPPTTTVDKGYFGYSDDRSDESANRWYVGAVDNPYPFAIHLFNVEGFKKIAVEGKEISYTYPDFAKWVSSNFTTNLDWHQNPADVD